MIDKTRKVSNIENYVFSGGGVRGLAYVGALEGLFYAADSSFLRVKNIAGSSVGSLTAAAMALSMVGSSSPGVMTISDFIYFRETVLKFRYKNLQADSFGFIRDVLRLVTEYGWHKGKYLRKFLEKELVRKGLAKDISMKDFCKAAGVGLYIPATNIRTGQNKVFSPSSEISLVDVVHASAAYPFYFVPVKVFEDPYVDGGLTNNYPIEIFKKDYPSTIGFSFALQPSHDPDSIGNVVQFSKKVLETFIESNKPHYSDAAWARTILLDIPPISALNFDLTEEDKESLILHGKHSVFAEFLEE